MKKPSGSAPRLILFLCFALLAVGSFTWGVVQLGHRERGYQTIDTDDAYGDVLFRAGLTLRYWAEGSSAEIRDLTERVSRVYSDSLYTHFRLLDPDQVYDGITNLASLNASPGEVLPVPSRLAAVLRDALEKTEQGIGYSVLAGPLFREWQTLLYLEDPEPFDPLNSLEEAERLKSLTGALRDPSAASLALSESKDQTFACLQVAPFLSDLMNALELSAPVLDLALLHDAYLMDLVAEDLLAAGYDQGVLYSRSGLTRCLRPGETLSVVPDNTHPANVLSASAPAAAARFSATEKWDQGYGAYAIGKTFRHAWIDVRRGEPAASLPQTALIASDETAVSVSWRMLQLLFSGMPAAE